MELNRSESTFKPALLLMGGRLAAFLATFFIPVVLVRVFSQSDFGTYKQIFLLFTTLYSIAQLGMAESLFYFVPRSPHGGGRYAFNAIGGLALAGLACLAGLFLARAWIAQWLSNPALSDYAPWLGAYLAFMLMSAALEIVMISYKRHLWASVSYALSDVLRAVLIIAPVLLAPSLRWLLAGAVLFAAARLAATLVYLLRTFGTEFRPDLSALKQQLAYAAPFEIAVAVEVLQANYHHYVVSHTFNAATFAVYSVGCLQIPIVEFLANPACNVMMVRMQEELRQQRPERAAQVWRDVTGKLALVFFPIFALLALEAREIITLLFTQMYNASVPVFVAWSATVALAALQTDGVLRVYAETQFLLGLGLLKLLLIATLIGVFLSRFYLLGAVGVTLVALVLAKALALARMKRLMGVGLAGLLPWARLAGVAAASAAAVVPAALAKWVLALPAFFQLAAVSAVYGLSFLAFIWQCGLLTSGERDALTGWIPRGALRAAGAGD